MKAAVVTFPGSNCDNDIVRVLSEFYSAKVDKVWHKDQFSEKYDLVILPGGFSYGDYLRSGAMAPFSPVMKSVKEHTDRGGKLFGICNGFQILAEAGYLPGALIRNRNLKYVCRTIGLKKASNSNKISGSLADDQILRVPVAHGDGCYFASADIRKQLKEEGRILFLYAGDNPNGSLDDIAGICSPDFKVAGMMPHPERAMNPITGEMDGKTVLDLLIAS